MTRCECRLYPRNANCSSVWCRLRPIQCLSASPGSLQWLTRLHWVFTWSNCLLLREALMLLIEGKRDMLRTPWKSRWLERRNCFRFLPLLYLFPRTFHSSRSNATTDLRKFKMGFIAKRRNPMTIDADCVKAGKQRGCWPKRYGKDSNWNCWFG